MTTVRSVFLSMLMMGAGAGLLGIAQRVGAKGNAEVRPPERGVAPTPGPSPQRVLVVGNGSSPATEQTLASVTERLANIEAKLDDMKNTNESEPAVADTGGDGLPPQPESRTPEEQASQESATRIVESAIERGTWTDADQERMRNLGATLPPGDRLRLRMKLSVAGNAGRLKDFASRPFFF